MLQAQLLSTNPTMILKSLLTIALIATSCVSDLYDYVVQKDEEVREVLTGPEGEDTQLFDAMKKLAQSYDQLAGELQANNQSVFPLARRLYDRGVPNMILETFFINDLRRFFNWYQEELDHFHDLYLDVQDKWRAFEQSYRNVSINL